ncbi:hypothetical protein EDB81DRAFT_883129 [Dactylonectria macrodidyma]|uniref:Uncharacterized protein n=1 Tax=Dactylonectria macrodidyma TaxID=307937 RepID=A0A9P9EY90_9HYPO|nr:hypothetical protein EDB81DRAFT_883129 [Dactylonectria macrodidyma]
MVDKDRSLAFLAEPYDNILRAEPAGTTSTQRRSIYEVLTNHDQGADVLLVGYALSCYRPIILPKRRRGVFLARIRRDSPQSMPINAASSTLGPLSRIAGRRPRLCWEESEDLSLTGGRDGALPVRLGAVTRNLLEILEAAQFSMSSSWIVPGAVTRPGAVAQAVLRIAAPVAGSLEAKRIFARAHDAATYRALTRATLLAKVSPIRATWIEGDT